MFTAYLAIEINRDSLMKIHDLLDPWSSTMWESQLPTLATSASKYSFVFHIIEDGGEHVDAILPNTIIEEKFYTAQTDDPDIRWINVKK